MSAVGTRVEFLDWTDDGEEVVFSGIVEDEFTEHDDLHGRANYSVRLDGGRLMTPYAHECRRAA